MVVVYRGATGNILTTMLDISYSITVEVNKEASHIIKLHKAKYKTFMHTNIDLININFRHNAIFLQYIIIDENEYSLNIASIISSNIQILSYLKI